jgi:hypothetical protein
MAHELPARKKEGEENSQMIKMATPARLANRLQLRTRFATLLASPFESWFVFEETRLSDFDVSTRIWLTRKKRVVFKESSKKTPTEPTTKNWMK